MESRRETQMIELAKTRTGAKVTKKGEIPAEPVQKNGQAQEKKWTPTPIKTASVFILDDHPIVRHGLAELIKMQEGLHVCGEGANAAEAFAGLKNLKPDLMLVDISLAGPNGIEFIKTAKEQFPDTLFLMHSMHDETLYAERALRAGARGYIMKQEAPQKMIQAIRRVLSGQIYMSEEMTERMLEQRYNGVTDNQVPMETLSDRELEVFQLIGKGETTSKIAKFLHRSVKTVETYRSRIKEKLNLKDNMQLIRHAMQSVYSEDSKTVKPAAAAPNPEARKKT